MTFDDVEKARLDYIEEKDKSEQKDHGPISKVIVKAFLIEFTIVIILTTVLLVVASNAKKIDLSNWMTTYLAALFIAILLTLMTVIIVVAFSSYPDTNVDEMFRNYRKAYKNYFIEKQLSKFFDFLKYNHESGLKKELLWDTGVLTTTCLYKSNDLVQGNYKGIDFMQADVTIRELEENLQDNSKTYRTFFDGRWLVFGLPKKFHTNMVITWLGNKKPNLKNGKNLVLVKTESEDFNRCFAVYAEDPIEGLAILNPALIERISQLGNKHDNYMTIYFINNLLFFALDRASDIFEPPAIDDMPLDEDTETERIMSDMRMMMDVVDTLKLDRKAR